MKPTRRAGFSLLEVLLAASILLGSLIVLGQLAAVGRKHAHDAEDLTAAELLCQSKLNEILAGVEPVRSLQQQPLAGAAGWVYSVEVQSLERLGLASLRVTVAKAPPEAAESVTLPPAKSFSLTRWIPDPLRQQPDEEGAVGVLPELEPEPLLPPDLGLGFEEEPLP